MAACDKVIKEAAFCKAIESEMSAPLSETYDANTITVNPTSYEGPHPHTDGLLEDMETEATLFEPGNLPREFVVVSD